MSILIDELTNDPLGIGYQDVDGSDVLLMSDEEVATSLNTANRPYNVTSISGTDLFEAADPTETDSLSADEKQKFYAITALNTIPINATNIKNAILAMFPGGSTTRTNLIALQTSLRSRAAELGLGTVKVGHVIAARTFVPHNPIA